jgi:hypothetical protein
MAGHDYHQHFILGRIYLYSGPHLKLKRDNGNVHYERLHFSIYYVYKGSDGPVAHWGL